MTILKNIKNHIIEGTKIDNCLPNWVEPAEVPVWTLCIALLFVLPVGTTFFYSKEPGTFVGALAIAMFVDAIILGACTLAAVLTSDGCGIRITLNSKSTWYCNPGIITCRTYKFTGDADADAKAIEKIVAGFEHIANTINFEKEQQEIAEETRRAELGKKSEACCKVFREVVEKVKKE